MSSQQYLENACGGKNMSAQVLMCAMCCGLPQFKNKLSNINTAFSNCFKTKCKLAIFFPPWMMYWLEK